ncbi:MAG: WD40 repeat domain-containing protein, partial [Pseudomonadota bacterium]
GASGDAEARAGQISKWTNLDAADPTRQFANRLEADAPPPPPDSEVSPTPPNARILASETGPNGALYALAETEGEIDGQLLRGEKDLALVKYDSAGKKIWTRVLGSTSETDGLSLAVASDGRVAIAGVTSGDLTPDAAGGGEDGFVTLYDADGLELFTRQRGSGFDDRIEALAFADDGSLFVAGRTKGSVGGATNSGGEDGFIEKLDTTGTALWSRQLGGSENDRVTALAVDASGGVVAASLEDGQTTLRRFASDIDDATDWTQALGEGVVRDLETDGAAVYAAGETRLNGRTAGLFSGASVDGADAFALRLDISGAVATEAWFTRFGGDGDQTSPAIKVLGDDVYVAGSGATAFGSATALGDKSAFVAKLGAADGVEAWASAINGRAGISSASGLAIDPTGASDLDLFGLPSGALEVGDTNNVTDRTSARPGDHFYLSVEGGRQKKITIEAGDTYRDLTFKINAALVLDGTSQVSSGVNGQALRISPNENTRLELIPGSEGQDALSALGLPRGVVFKEPIGDTDASSDAPELVALGLDLGAGFTTKEEAADLVDMLDGALRAIRQAYRIATDDPTLRSLTEGGQSSGQVPAYLQAQLANYQAGLTRLGGVTGFTV